MGYKEISHTADWSIHVWAEDIQGLLTESARGMWMLTSADPADGPRAERELSLEAYDAESLLVAFLEELLYLSESEKLLFDDFSALSVEGRKLSGIIGGGPLRSIEKEIKAVTFHNLDIRESKGGLEVEIVFDV